MSNTYSWVITQIEYHENAEGQTKLAYNLYWTYSATDKTGKFVTEVKDTTEIAYNPNVPYVDFDTLTQDIVSTWVVGALGNDAIAILQQTLDTQLENLKSNI
jgi:hypothetical protein